MLIAHFIYRIMGLETLRLANHDKYIIDLLLLLFYILILLC